MRFFNDFANNSQFGLNPGLDVFIADGVSVGGGFSFSSTSDTDPRLALFAWGTLFFGYEADAKTGPAHSFSLSVSIRNLLGGLDSFAVFTPNYSFCYFLTDRVAPYVRIYAIDIGIRNTYGEFIPETEPFVFAYISVVLGFSYFVPSSKLLG